MDRQTAIYLILGLTLGVVLYAIPTSMKVLFVMFVGLIGLFLWLRTLRGTRVNPQHTIREGLAAGLTRLSQEEPKPSHAIESRPSPAGNNATALVVAVAVVLSLIVLFASDGGNKARYSSYCSQPAYDAAYYGECPFASPRHQAVKRVIGEDGIALLGQLEQAGVPE